MITRLVTGVAVICAPVDSGSFCAGLRGRAVATLCVSWGPSTVFVRFLWKPVSLVLVLCFIEVHG